MGKETNAKATESASTAPKTINDIATKTSEPLHYKPQEGLVSDIPADAGSRSGMAKVGIADAVKNLNVGGFFTIPRKDNGKGGFKRDNSKFAGVVRTAKKLGYTLVDKAQHDHNYVDAETKKRGRADEKVDTIWRTK